MASMHNTSISIIEKWFDIIKMHDHVLSRWKYTIFQTYLSTFKGKIALVKFDNTPPDLTASTYTESNNTYISIITSNSFSKAYAVVVRERAWYSYLSNEDVSRREGSTTRPSFSPSSTSVTSRPFSPFASWEANRVNMHQ